MAFIFHVQFKNMHFKDIHLSVNSTTAQHFLSPSADYGLF